MNGKNGTAFDWYVNDHLPCFFIFYKDDDHLGAVKATLYTDGNMSVYVYGDKGNAEPMELEVRVDVDEQALFELAVMLTVSADGNKVWDAEIRNLACEGKPDEQSVKLFAELREAFEPMIERRKMLGMTAIISKKVRTEGWKIGYGVREEPTREGDSGWFFSVGDETEDYVNNPANLELWAINSVLTYDYALTEFIAAPYGTAVVRVDHDRFEIDEPGKDVFIEKKS